MAEEKKKTGAGGTKRKKKNKPTSKKYSKYRIEGDRVIREKTCPRCGPGVFLMNAKDRSYCGRCHLTEFISKKEEIKEEKGN